MVHFQILFCTYFLCRHHNFHWDIHNVNQYQRHSLQKKHEISSIGVNIVFQLPGSSFFSVSFPWDNFDSAPLANLEFFSYNSLWNWLCSVFIYFIDPHIKGFADVFFINIVNVDNPNLTLIIIIIISYVFFSFQFGCIFSHSLIVHSLFFHFFVFVIFCSCVCDCLPSTISRPVFCFMWSFLLILQWWLAGWFVGWWINRIESIKWCSKVARENMSVTALILFHHFFITSWIITDQNGKKTGPNPNDGNRKIVVEWYFCCCRYFGVLW